MQHQLKREIGSYLTKLQEYTKIDMFYLAKGSFWSSLSFTLSSMLSLLLVLAFANFLPKETYGTYKYIMSIAGSLGFLTFTGMNTAVVQMVANGYDGIVKYAVRVQLRWNLLFSGSMLIVAIYYFINHNSLFGITLLILGFTSPFTAAFNTYGAFLSGRKEFKKASIYAAITSIIYTTAMLATIYLTQNLIIIIISYSLANLIPNIYLYYNTIRSYKLKHVPVREEKELFRYGGHLSIIGIFSTISQYIDKIIVFHFLGAIQLAVYALALAMPERIKGYTKIISSIILPKLAEKNINDIKQVFYKRTIQSMAVGIVLSIGYIILAPFIFRLLLPAYSDSIIYSQVISLGLIFTMPATYMGSVFRAQKMIRLIYLSSIVSHVSRIVLFVVLGISFGIWGVITASLALYGIGLIYNLILWKIEMGKISMIDNLSIDPETLPE